MAHKHLAAKHYVFTWLGLCVLTMASFATSYAPLGSGDLVISLAIAVAKTLLVLLVFMHLIEQRFVNQMVVVMSFFMVVLLASLMAGDVATRHTFPKGAEPPPPTVEPAVGPLPPAAAPTSP